MFTWNCFIVFAVVNFLISHYLFIVLLIFAQFSACVDRECNIISVLVTIVPAFNLTSVSCCAMWKFVLADELFVVISVGVHIACYLWVEHHINHAHCVLYYGGQLMWCNVDLQWNMWLFALQILTEWQDCEPSCMSACDRIKIFTNRMV